jgi:hypothetical protein
MFLFVCFFQEHICLNFSLRRSVGRIGPEGSRLVGEVPPLAVPGKVSH